MWYCKLECKRQKRAAVVWNLRNGAALVCKGKMLRETQPMNRNPMRGSRHQPPAHVLALASSIGSTKSPTPLYLRIGTCHPLENTCNHCILPSPKPLRIPTGLITHLSTLSNAAWRTPPLPVTVKACQPSPPTQPPLSWQLTTTESCTH